MAGYWPCSFFARLWTETRIKRSLPISSHLDPTPAHVSTFRAAIFEVPITFPSLSFTSIPVNSSWFLIRTTLQIFAVARRREENFVSLSQFANWLMFDKKRTGMWFLHGAAFLLLSRGVTHHKRVNVRNTGNVFLQLVLQHCCSASWNNLLRVLPPAWPTCSATKHIVAN